MQIVQAKRASAILYNLLVNRQDQHPWLLPANICPIVPITFLKARVPFKFVDISARTLHMDLEQAEAMIQEHTFGGLLYAHTYGERSTPNEFFTSIKSFSPELMIIDDRCLCIPDLEIQPANKADVQLYSTGYAKIVDLNFGGYAFLREDIDYETTSLPFHPQAHQDIEKSYKHSINQRTKFIYQDSDWLDTESFTWSWGDYCQQIAENLLKSLKQREQLNEVYTRDLPADIQLSGEFQSWRFNILVKNKKDILEKVFSADLFASPHYASLAGIMDDGHAPYAERLAANVINLFNDHHFTVDQAKQICKIILENLH
jgi:hypothetical protein